MSIDEILQSWRNSRNISPCLTAVRVFEKRDGEYRPFPELIHSALKGALRQKGIDHLFSHQAEAVIAVNEGKDTEPWSEAATVLH